MSVVALKSDTLVRRQEAEYLQSLAERMRLWKLREGKSYFSMPTAYWDEAVAVARKMGATAAARALGLSREELLRRMGGPASAESVKAALAEEAEFCELPGVSQALAAPQAPPAITELTTEQAPPADIAAPLPGEATMEMTDTDGARLTLRLPVAGLDVASLVHAFRSRT